MSRDGSATVQLHEFGGEFSEDASDALIDAACPGRDKGHGLGAVGELVGEAVQPLVQVQAAVRAVTLIGESGGVNGGTERGADRLLQYRESFGEQQQRQVRRSLAAPGHAAESHDQVEALRRRRGRTAAALAEASAWDVPRQETGSPPADELLGGDGEVVTRRVIDELLVGRAGAVAGRHGAKVAAPAPVADRF
ncbi:MULTISPECIES: hypothetical protein [unclassified Streptomyces]|uniref:hypothetical protein n=1 Tax=unclassified Streptomyces TaxID=2593676 RepID=UPI00344B0E02